MLVAEPEVGHPATAALDEDGLSQDLPFGGDLWDDDMDLIGEVADGAFENQGPRLALTSKEIVQRMRLRMARRAAGRGTEYYRADVDVCSQAGLGSGHRAPGPSTSRVRGWDLSSSTTSVALLPGGRESIPQVSSQGGTVEAPDHCLHAAKRSSDDAVHLATERGGGRASGLAEGQLHQRDRVHHRGFDQELAEQGHLPEEEAVGRL